MLIFAGVPLWFWLYTGQKGECTLPKFSMLKQKKLSIFAVSELYFNIFTEKLMLYKSVGQDNITSRKHY
ncbi:hypothetical protein QQ39_15035 [Pragia fontium]|nr:hypothetical protein QQ39_15035 [Pragia fontium]